MGYKHRRKIIVSKLQLPFIITFLGLIIGVSIIPVVVLFSIFQSYLSSLSIPEVVTKQMFGDAILFIVIVAVVLFVVCCFVVLIISNKIYGPLWRFNQNIKKMSDGEKIEDFQTRKGDAIHDISESFNILAAHIERAQYFHKFELLP